MLGQRSRSTHGPVFSSLSRYVWTEHRKFDRQFAYQFDRIRRLHLRKADERLEAHGLRPRLYDLSLFVASTVIMYAIGGIGSAALFFLRN